MEVTIRPRYIKLAFFLSFSFLFTPSTICRDLLHSRACARDQGAGQKCTKSLALRLRGTSRQVDRW